ncbi:MAG: bifunctional 3-deoxy-7-phosphoheptulonate synthase/chorismate mutase type II [Bacteroidales bacterium]|nr:bifunctional 3-deoxy-7-phosphoheptulonate synthase/chorismate mutase type II [Bacteroidales bacterium]
MESKITTSAFEGWNLDTQRPLIIAGPCSAETEEQVLETARRLKATRTQIFRAGIWKPRTRPNSFEGVGVKGLKWLKMVKEETGLLTTTEVANAQHVYEALKYGIDMLWIGARTTVNPFTIQEIANALSGVDIPIFIKNPVNPDVDLWIGSIERLQKVGITRIAGVHRGFSSFSESRYRNAPNWQIPIELKRIRPDLPLICDPSHISGKRNLLLEVSQKAMDLNFDGLMIETHPDPDNAWSDARQQITPEQLAELLDHLILRKTDPGSNGFMSKLEELRSEIDRLDQELLMILEDRMKVAASIGQCKKENGVTILQSARWDQIISKYLEVGQSKGFSEEFIRKLFMAIHQESINTQTRIMNE